MAAKQHLRHLPGQSRLTGVRRSVDSDKLARSDVRAAMRDVQAARRDHGARLRAADLSQSVDIMETRRRLIDAERNYQQLTGEQCP